MESKSLENCFFRDCRTILIENNRALCLKCDETLYWKNEALERFCSQLSIDPPADFKLNFASFIKALPFDAISLTDQLVDENSIWLKAQEAFTNIQRLDEISSKLHQYKNSSHERVQLSCSSKTLNSSSKLATNSLLMIDLDLINKAIQLCRDALDAVNNIKTYLSNAYDWSMWDLLGGAPKSTALKVEQLEQTMNSIIQTQLMTDNLQWRLELINSSARNILRVNIAEFETFSYRFFDAFVSDLICLTPFPTSLKELKRLDNELTSTNNYLNFGANALVTTIKTIYN